MNTVNIKVLRLPHGEGLPLPVYATDGAAGADICAAENVVIPHGTTVKIKTGLSFEIPVGYEIQIRPRSGLASRGYTVPNAPGTIDSDYRGELMILLHNGSFHAQDLTVLRGDRVAQAVVAPVTQGFFREVEQLSSTARGEGGFGSTGVQWNG